MLPGETEPPAACPRSDPFDDAAESLGLIDPITGQLLKSCKLTIGNDGKNWVWKVTFED